jgi:hypothetical protein
MPERCRRSAAGLRKLPPQAAKTTTLLRES